MPYARLPQGSQVLVLNAETRLGASSLCDESGLTMAVTLREDQDMTYYPPAEAFTLDEHTRIQDYLRRIVPNYDHTAHHFPYSLPTRAVSFPTLAILRREVKASGSHFFDADTLRFFNSRVLNTFIGGRFFVTTERMEDSEPRSYTVRYFYRHGGYLTSENIGDFRQHASSAMARQAASEAYSTLYPRVVRDLIAAHYSGAA